MVLSLYKGLKQHKQQITLNSKWHFFPYSDTFWYTLYSQTTLTVNMKAKLQVLKNMTCIGFSNLYIQIMPYWV